MPQEQPPGRMLHTPAHLEHILHDLLDGRIGHRHVDGADGDHEVQAGYDVSGVSVVSGVFQYSTAGLGLEAARYEMRRDKMEPQAG